MVKINRLSLFLLLRSVQFLLLLFLRLSNAFTSDHLWAVLAVMALPTLFVIARRFTNPSKNKRFNLPSGVTFLAIVVFLILTECLFFLLLPLGYFDFSLFLKFIVAIEAIFSIMFEYIKPEKLT